VRPQGAFTSVELRRALHRAFEDWITERFGSRVERAVRILTIRDLVRRDVALLPGPTEPQELQLAAV